MRDRDPGSAPQVNDRIPYVFVESDTYKPLMGECIEHIDYVRANPDTVKINTLLYIESQIMKPCLQLLGIALEGLPGYSHRPALSGPGALDSIVVAKSGNVVKAQVRLDDLREAEVKRMLFDPHTNPLVKRRDARVNPDRVHKKNVGNNQYEITCFFPKKA
jgi:hypothetical protein